MFSDQVEVSLADLGLGHGCQGEEERVGSSQERMVMSSCQERRQFVEWEAGREEWLGHAGWRLCSGR